MTRRIDLNADMGESFGPWVMGQDAALLDIVTSANIACGMHAGDPVTMARTMRLAAEKNVSIGAHPGFADLQGFGRRRIKLPEHELRSLIQYQTAAAQGMARAVGAKMTHVKLHGAMGNMTSEDVDMARICFEAALSVAPDARLIAITATAQQAAAEDLGAEWAGEIFADRAYANNGLLVDRSQPGAVIHDPSEAAARVVQMVQENAIITGDGTRLEGRIDTICLHGDGKTALDIARAVRAGLTAAGIELAPF